MFTYITPSVCKGRDERNHSRQKENISLYRGTVRKLQPVFCFRPKTGVFNGCTFPNRGTLLHMASSQNILHRAPLGAV